MFKAVKSTQVAWALSLRGNNYQPKDDVNQDPAFDSKFSLLSSDQGVRGFLHIINDMVYKKAKEKELRNIKWQIDNEEIKEDRIDQNDLKLIIEDFGNSSISPFVKKICEELIKFDWRTSSEPGLSYEQRRKQMVFKGSSGYKELRTQLLNQLSISEDEELKDTAIVILHDLGYDS